MVSQNRDLDSIMARLEALEAQSRRLKRGLKAGALALGVTLLMGAWRQPAKTIEAEQFVVRDQEGRKRLVLGLDKPFAVYEKPLPGLSLYDEDGNARLLLNADKQSAGMSVVEGQEIRAVFSAKKDGFAGLMIYRRGEDRKRQILLCYTDEGKPVLGFNDKNGKTRFMVMMEKDERPALLLQDENGKAFFAQAQSK